MCCPNLLFKFIVYLQDECKFGHGGRLGYIEAISEMIDFRKLHGAWEAFLRKFSATELYNNNNNNNNNNTNNNNNNNNNNLLIYIAHIYIH